MRASDESPHDEHALLAPRWIDDTIRRIRAVDSIGRPVHDEVKRTAVLLLCMAEADAFPVPDVENFGRCGLAFSWVRGARVLEIALDRRSARQIRSISGRVVLDRHLKAPILAIPWIRAAFGWLSPDYCDDARGEGRP